MNGPFCAGAGCVIVPVRVMLPPKPGSAPAAGLLLMSGGHPEMSNVEPYNCPYCQTKMVFEEQKNRYRCPDCRTIVGLADSEPEDEPEDSE